MTRISSRIRGSIVIGGGHNGLVCVAYMGKGGAAMTETFHPGFRNSVACINRGVRTARMHDVPATRDAVQMMEAVLGMCPPVRRERNPLPTHNVQMRAAPHSEVSGSSCQTTVVSGMAPRTAPENHWIP